MTDASSNSPRTGENVPEAQQYDQILRDEAVSIVDRVAEGHLLRHHLPDDIEEMEKTVRRARIQLELVEEMLATRREEIDDDE